jgi:uncharacterized membrane protein
MSVGTYQLVKAAHVIAIVLWISGLTAIYWLLRFHDHAPKEAREQLTLQERALALATDIACAVAIGTGLAMAIPPAPGHATSFFTEHPNMWLHVKLTAIVLMILPVHGMLRARIKRYGLGQIKPVPTWLWTLLLGGVTIAILCVVTRLSFLPTDASAPAAGAGSAVASPH